MGGGRISNGAEGQSQRFEISDRPDYVRHNEINCQSQFPSPPPFTHIGWVRIPPPEKILEREGRSARGPTPETEIRPPSPLRNVNYKALGLPESRQGPVTPVPTLLSLV